MQGVQQVPRALQCALELTMQSCALGVLRSTCECADQLAGLLAAVDEELRGRPESVGNERVLQQAYAATARGGMTVTMGLPHPSKQFSISAVSLTVEERTVKGSYMGSCVPSRDLPRFVALYQAGRLPVDRLLTHRLTLDEINAGFDRLARGEAVRQVILMG